MAAAAIAASVAGGAVSAYGSYTAGLAQQNYYKYLAQNATTEADLAIKQGDQQATFAENEGAAQTKLQTMKSAEVMGAQKATIGANMGGGSATAADIVTDSFNKSKMDALAIKYNADVKAWNATNNAKLSAWNLRNQAAGDIMAGKEAKRAGTIGAISSLLGSAGQVGGQWTQAKYMGAV